MPRVALISDTHIPSRKETIPGWVVEAVEAADYTIHAGDFDSDAAFERVREIAGETLTACAGNTDPPTLGLPDVATLDVEGVRFVVTHGTGDPDTYKERVAGIAAEHGEETVIGVSGHTHHVHDEVVDGVRLLNPGSATGAAPALTTTMLVVDVEGDYIAVSRVEGWLHLSGRFLRDAGEQQVWNCSRCPTSPRCVRATTSPRS
ncbi:metallophosphoesterase family protein [Haladaptatus sp. GCM10025893]|uniref:metallophosphoesterase family protein n=2 Tax=Haladaptatus TaxID=367188 RepID=UPI003620164A